MLQTAWKSALAHKARLALTSVAILLGVAFVSGSFVFTDTIQARFESLFSDVYAGTDASVRGVAAEFGGDVRTEFPAVPQTVVTAVSALPEVAEAAGYIQGFGQIIDADGKPVGGMGPPTYVYSWVESPALNPFRITDGNGRAPTASGELVVDAATAQTAALSVGDRVSVQFASGTESFQLVGIVSFGDSNNLAGATIATITFADAQRILGLDGQVTFVDVVGVDSVSQDALVDSIAAVLPPSAEVVTGDQLTAEAISGFTDGLGFLSTALLGFAGVAVFVGAFIIFNTFRIVVAQRTRELALLRAVGASPRQVVTVVLTEALTVAVIASALGVLAGIGFAQLIKAAMGAVGFGPPDGPLTIEPRTFVIGMAVGILVTLAAALVPALHAARVPPVAAMQSSAGVRPARPVRTLLRVGILAVGAASVGFGLLTDRLLVTSLGAVVAVIAVLLLAPVLTRPVTWTVGRPIPGAVGLLARQNTARDPRRTSATASALTIGIALVVFTAIFAASTKDSIASSLDEAFPADLVVAPSNMYMAITPAAAEAVAAVPEVGVVSALRAGAAQIDGVDATVTAFNADTIEAVYTPGADVALATVGDGLLVQRTLVDEGAVAVGDTMTVAFPTGKSAALQVVGSFRDTTLGSYAVTGSTWDRLGGSSDAVTMLIGLAPGVGFQAGRTAVEKALAGFPSLTVNSVSDQIAAATAQVDAFLVLFTALLAMALFIAVLGIANTLALSIVERTREIGLLRAVGLSRRQVRAMITSEAVVTAVFGALLGSLLGVALGWVVVTAFAAEGLSSFSIPVLQVLLWLAVSALAGVIAAALPARKAARLDVLEAIAYE